MKTVDKKSIVSVFKAAVEQWPQNTAIEQGNNKLAYKQLDDLSSSLAAHLAKAGMIEGSVIGILMDLTPEYVISVLAVTKIRGVFLPLRPDLPAKRLNYIISEVKPCCIITLEGVGIESELTSVVRMSLETDGGLAIDGSKLPVHVNDDIPLRTSSPDDSLYIFFTSGSTGEPKAVLGRHVSLAHFLDWESSEFAVGPDIRVSGLTSIMLDMSLRDIFLPLLNGGTLCIPTSVERDSTLNLLRWIQRARINLIHIVPSFFSKIMDEIPDGAVEENSLKFVLLAGEALYSTNVLTWAGKLGPNATFCNFYGPTEATLTKIFHRINLKDLAPNAIVKLGVPISKTQILILDEDQRICPPGKTGEICIKTEFLSKGYYLDANLHSRKFIQNPLHNDFADIIYRTGDLGAYDDRNEIHFCGRVDRQVKIMGYRIELDEIEIRLKGHDQVNDAAVIVAEDDVREKRIVAFVCSEMENITDMLPAYIEAHLPPYMVPSEFIKLAEMPLNSNGKLDRLALAGMLGETNQKNAEFMLPRTETENRLVRIWSEVLGRKSFGIQENFFRIGGHSLEVMIIISKIYKEFNVELSIRQFFENPTIMQLSELIDKSILVEYYTINPVEKAATYAISHAQKRIWIQNQIDEESLAYNINMAFLLKGNLQVGSLERALEAVIQRHESLRTTICMENGQPRQRIGIESQCKLQVLDFSSENFTERNLEQLIFGQSSDPFDLENGPLMRMKLMKIKSGEQEGKHSQDASEYVLLANIHHIVSDSWSLGIITRELITLYDRFSRGLDNMLEPLRIQYKDYAAWQNSTLQGNLTNPNRAYWKQKLEGLGAALELITDFPRPTIKTFKGAAYSYQLDVNVFERLKALGDSWGVTLYPTLLSLVKILLFKYTGQTDIVTGVSIAGRGHADLQNQVGIYANTLALRDSLTNNESLESVFKRVKQTTLEAYEHQMYPFDVLIEEIGLKKDPARNPLFDVLVELVEQEDAQYPQVPGLGIQAINGTETRLQVSKFDLTLNFLNNENAPRLYVEYNTDLFKQERIASLCVHLEALFRNAVASPNASINELSFLPEPDSVIAGTWYNSLGKDGGNLEENFFELGGDKEAAARISEALSNKLKVTVLPGDILLYPVLGQLITFLKLKLKSRRRPGQMSILKK